MCNDEWADSFAVIEPNVPAVNETDWIFADKRDGHFGISALPSKGIVSGRKSAASFDVVDDRGLGGTIKFEGREVSDNDEKETVDVAVAVEFSSRWFNEHLSDLHFFVAVSKMP